MRTLRIDALPHRVVASSREKTRQPIVVFSAIGGRVMRLLGLQAFSSSLDLCRAVGIAIVVCPAIMVLSLRVGVIVGVALVSWPAMRIRRARFLRRRAIERDMPMVIDLLNLAVQSGLTIGASLAYVVAALDSPVCEVYGRGLQQLTQGRRLFDVLEDCEDELGEAAFGLTSALQSAERYGSPLGETLAQLVLETRFDQERRAEQSARRLSVHLLFPVAGCILPAFALLTVAPLLAGSIGTLADSFH
jgi:pilus assembly protein TadC